MKTAERLYRLQKLAGIDANLIYSEITEGLKNSIMAASGGHLPPFMSWLAQDGCSLTFTVKRSDSFWGDKITVENLNVSDFSKSLKYSGLLQAIQAYLRKFPQLFTEKKNEQSVDYNNFSCQITIRAPKS